MDVGSHCTVCGRLDFLPFDCRICNKVLCGDHRMHDCIQTNETINKKSANSPAQSTSQTKSQSTKITPQQPRANRGTAQKEFSKKTPGQRLGSSPKPPDKNERAMAALDRLKNLIGGRPKPSVSKPRTILSPEARRNAVGQSQIPLTERVYFSIERVRHEFTDQLTRKTVVRPPKIVFMFFEKHKKAGQILDRASTQLAVPTAQLLDSSHNPIDLTLSATELPEQLLIVPKQ